MLQFNHSDLELLKQKDISIESIENQLSGFRKGFPFAQLISAATPGNGIVKLNDESFNKLIELYKSKRKNINSIKFVPASGAASRMFKHLFEFKEDISIAFAEEIIELPKYKAVKEFFSMIEQFAFYDDLLPYIKNYSEEDKQSKYSAILDFLLDKPGLDYANKPKALLKFHKYQGFSRLSLEEHLIEAADYCVMENEKAQIHFTVSPDHLEAFQTALNQLIPNYQKQLGIQFSISFSIQKSSTDTIAVDLNNEPFRDEKGKMVFRPGGHGALIENLNDLNADLIFIKNIDNVVYASKRQISTEYKMALAGLALQLNDKIKLHLSDLRTGKLSEECIDFIQNELQINIETSKNLLDSERIIQLISLLNRPLRVCGMVKNEGEPGGGPFFVQKENGVSLQIVESAEIDIQNPLQKQIMQKSTHFNPVDLICITKDIDGKMFNLRNFVDVNSGFISEKSKDGKVLKAMELSGLWNGAMANWTTIFVEVPIETFNPVKTVNDLLRPMHRGF